MSYSKIEDHKLIALMQADDKLAFSELYNRYWDRLYQMAYIKTNDYFLAEEVIQDVFLAIWNKRYEISRDYNINAYLAVALKYRIINARLKKSKLENYIRNAYNDNNKAKVYSLDQELDFNELKRSLQKHVAQLPEKSRLVYQLSKEDGLTQKEIAQKLKISEKTVESHLSRAMKSIRSKFRYFILLLKYRSLYNKI